MSWKITTLGEIIDLQNGYAFKSSEYTDSGYFLMRITNVQQGFIQNKNPKYVTIPHDSKLKKFILNKGDILMSLTGDVGRVGEIKDTNLPAVLNQRVARVIIKSNLKIDKNYLFSLLNSDNLRHQIESMGQGAAQLNVSTNDILSIKILLPPLPIQHKIVKKLDTIFAEIDKATAAVEANIKNAEALFQCYLSEVFKRGGNGWIVKKLKNITDKIGSGATPRGGNESYKTSGTSLIRSMNIYDEGFYYPKLAFIDNIQAKQLDNVKIEKEDVLLNITGASIARCCIVPDKILPARVNQHVSILRANRNIIIPKLIHYLLISPFHKNKLLSVGEGSGATRQALTKAQLQEYEISFPSDLNSQLKLVEKISDFYSHTFLIKNIYRDMIKNFPLLKQSILKRAFNDELVKAA